MSSNRKLSAPRLFRLSWCLVFLGAALPIAGSLRAQTKPRDKVFVPPVQGTDIKPAVLGAMFDLVVVAVSRADVVDVVTVEDVREQLAQEKRKDALGCTNVSCATDIAGALGVRYLLATRAKKLGSNLIVTVSLIDTAEQRSKNGQGKCADKEDEYDKAVESAVAEALGLVKHSLAGPNGASGPAGESTDNQDATTGGSDPGDCPTGMAWLPSGSFKMGQRGDTPPVASYCLDVNEVRVDTYAACVRGGKCSEAQTGGNCNGDQPERAKHPVNCVDWNQASSYCAAVGKRLPTEEEWEWAARGAANGTTYPWGNAPPRSQLCWSGLTKRDSTCAVGSFPGGASPQGLQDLAGNVWEWTSTTDGANRILRGGCWSYDNPDDFAAANRSYGYFPTKQSICIGFRCAKNR